MQPLYLARTRDLGRADLVKVDCAACRHVALLTPEFLLRLGRDSRVKMLDPTGRVRCRGLWLSGGPDPALHGHPLEPQHHNNIDLAGLLSHAAATRSATPATTPGRRNTYAEGAAPGWGEHLRRRSHLGLAGTQPSPILIRHARAGLEIRLAADAALAPYPARGDDLLAHQPSVDIVKNNYPSLIKPIAANDTA